MLSLTLRFRNLPKPPRNGFDLNRNFPDPIKNKGQNLRVPLATSQPEVGAMMNFSLGAVTPFTAAANLHEGSIVRGGYGQVLLGGWEWLG